MNRASMLKCRIPDTHYCPEVGRWNTWHRERHKQKEKDTDLEGLCVRERRVFILCS